ncbi:hypothetical protein DUD79_27740 [Priestia aryabhattai]
MYKSYHVRYNAYVTRFVCLWIVGIKFFFSIIGIYTFPFTIYTINPYYGIKLKIRWEMLV